VNSSSSGRPDDGRPAKQITGTVTRFVSIFNVSMSGPVLEAWRGSASLSRRLRKHLRCNQRNRCGRTADNLSFHDVVDVTSLPMRE
jgi:hypothetical protein